MITDQKRYFPVKRTDYPSVFSAGEASPRVFYAVLVVVCCGFREIRSKKFLLKIYCARSAHKSQSYLLEYHMDRINKKGKKTVVTETLKSAGTQKLGTAGATYTQINTKGQ